MKFERETNLYQDQALARKFKSQDTEFEIIQGHINAMISESEIRELINGGKTMYSAMNDIDVDVKGLTANLSELRSTVDGNSGQITELDSKQAEYEATLERFSGSLTQVDKDLSGVAGRVTTVEGTAEGLKTSVSEFNTKISNKIDTYFYGYAPTLSNVPASGWDTTELKEAHKDAIFYDTSTGYCYRFTKSGQSYSWVRIKDSDIDGKVETYYQPDNNDPSAAWTTDKLKQNHIGDMWYKSTTGKYVRWNGTSWVEITATPSNDVMFLINAKARIFTIQPIPPYYEGDLWLKSDTQDIYQCVNMRTKGSFVATDWTYASKYTDDTVANNVADNLRNNYSTTTQITQNSNGIMTEAISHVDGKHYISQINQTADSVQIKADKINLTGVTTFARAEVALEGSQRIYATARSTASQYKPVAPTEWVTNTSYTHGVWTTERPAYDPNYPILYTLTQKKTTNGSISNSSVLRDMAMTVIDGDSITTGTIDADYVDVINIDASNINTGYLSADRISGGTIDANDVTIENLSASDIKTGYLSASRISGGILDANDITVKNLSASSINGGTMSANYISGGTLNFNNITTKNLSASDITTGSMSANRISGGTLSVGGGDSVGRITVKDSSGSNYGFWDSGSLNIGPNNQFHVDNLGQVWCQYLSITEESGNGSVVINSNDSWSHIYLNNGRLQSRSLDVTGTKSRVAETKDYGKRLLYCYETPTPMFGDVGDAVVAHDGLCYIQIDPTFAETISTNQYQVFLQRYGEGDCYVKERHNTYFVVKGTPGLEFGWEIKAKQLGFSQLRLDRKNGDDDVDTRNSVNYEEDAINHINEINYGRVTV